MKRVSYVLLLGLMLFMTIGSAAAKTRSHKKPKETLVDQQPGPAVRSTPIKKEKKDAGARQSIGQQKAGEDRTSCRAPFDESERQSLRCPLASS